MTIPSEVQQFIYAHIDSIEILNVLQLLHEQRQRSWSAQEVSDELRTNPASASNRLTKLHSIGLLEVVDLATPKYSYKAASSELDTVVDALLEQCRIRRHQVYAVVFSPLKRSREFAEAFRIRGKNNGEGNDNG